jgi:hypothetical protein
VTHPAGEAASLAETLLPQGLHRLVGEKEEPGEAEDADWEELGRSHGGEKQLNKVGRMILRCRPYAPTIWRGTDAPGSLNDL